MVNISRGKNYCSLSGWSFSSGALRAHQTTIVVSLPGTLNLERLVEQVRAGWQEIRRQEELQRQLLEGEAARKQEEAERKARARKQQNDAASTEQEADTSQRQQQNGISRQSGKGAGTATKKKLTANTSDQSPGSNLHHGNGKMPDSSPILPQPDPDDDEPDRL